MRARPPELSQNSVFLNIPYGDRFRRLYLAYIAGLIHLGLNPRATLEIPGGRNRLEKILELIRACRYSIHDLSRVELDRTPPCTPRFNMPFELGLTVASTQIDDAPHDWFVFEAVNRRAAKSLSDLAGTDANIHHGTVEGIMRELCNAFVRRSRESVSVTDMIRIYRALGRLVAQIESRTRARSLFEAGAFRLLCSTARGIAIQQTRQSGSQPRRGPASKQS